MSAVTFTGANGIDWGTVLNAVITQERQPIDYLASQQTALKTQSSAFATLASRLGALESVADALTRAAAFGARTASTTDDTVVGASATTGAVPGTYDITVTELARSQVTGSSSRHADTGTTVVATGGTITIGGKAVTLSGSVTLAGLAEAINGTTDIGVTATIVQSETGYQIVLTGTATGAAKGFTVTNALTGSTVAFTDTDLDGVSGDSSADNATQASDAKITVNNVTVTSSTNTITDAIPGTTLTLLRKQPSTPVTVSIREDLGNTETLVKGFVDAYNGLITFAQQQTSSTSGIGRDPMLKGLRNELRSVISASYAAGGTLSSLGQTGIEFDRTGKLTINSTLLRDALEEAHRLMSTLREGWQQIATAKPGTPAAP